jgi:hypothetical protein
MNEKMIVFIAMVCHQANKAWCSANGDHSQVDWENAEQWQKDSAINGVKFKIENPLAGDDAQHNNWMKEKIADGWVYGEVKDAEAKTHPCIVPYNELPEFQQKKDALFSAIVNALKPETEVFEPTEIVAVKRLRQGLDAALQNVRNVAERFVYSREKLLSITKLQESIMWLGMDLKRMNEPNPYPSSKDPSTGDKIEPTADNLKL